MLRLALVAVAVLVTILSAYPANASSSAFPRIMIVSGGELRQQVVISDWEQIAKVISRVAGAPVIPRAQLAYRPRLTLSLFWGPRWNDYLAAGRSPRALRPAQADQRGSYYPAYGAKAAAIDLPWAGRWPRVVPRPALRTLVRFGVPGRLAEPVDPWARFRRPLQLPRLERGVPCPVSSVDPTVDWDAAHVFGRLGIGPGPVYPVLGSESGFEADPDSQDGGVWRGEKVFWYIRPSYAGPVLIRGRRLDGSEWLRFGGGTLPSDELRITEGETVIWAGQPPASRGWASTVRARAAGCYGVQVDGTTFSRTVVFSVTLSG